MHVADQLSRAVNRPIGAFAGSRNASRMDIAAALQDAGGGKLSPCAPAISGLWRTQSRYSSRFVKPHYNWRINCYWRYDCE